MLGIKALLLSVILSCLFFMQSATYANDYTDTKGPTVSAKLLQGLPSKGNVVVFEVLAQDEKNEIVNNSFSGLLTHDFLASSTGNIAPACFRKPKMFSYIGMQLIPLQQQSVKLASGSYESKFILVFYLEPMVQLPQGCPEWRQGIYFYNAFSIKDTVGNSSLLIDDPPPWQTRRAALSPYMEQLNPKNATDASSYCFMPPYSKAQRDVFSRDLQSYQNRIDRHRGKSYAQNILAKFDEKYFRYSFAAEYFQNSQAAFNLEQFRNFKLCKNLNSLDYYDLPWTSPGELSFIETERELSTAEGLELERLRIEAEAKAKAEAEAKAKADAEARERARAEAKAKADAEAIARAEAKAKASRTITCVKGKISKQVTSSNPKCPKGYKKK